MNRYGTGGCLRLFAALLAVVLFFCTAPAEAVAQAASPVIPDRVALSSISSPSYREVTLSWKEAAGANYYFVY